MTAPEIFAVVVALISLLWNVANAAKLRDHEKALQVNEAHLRVTAELRLRLHQQSWDLLRELNTAAFNAFEALRTYTLTAVGSQRSSTASPVFGADYQSASSAIQKFSGLVQSSPPDKVELRAASSSFSKAFNLINKSLLGGPPMAEQFDEIMRIATDGLAATAVDTRSWNEELWHQQTITALAKVEHN